MIAIDTNILVYAHRPETPAHDAAKAALGDLIAQGERVGLPVHCLFEFAGVVRHPKLWRQPSSVAQAREQVAAWVEPPNVFVLVEDAEMLPLFWDLVAAGDIRGGGVHDARIIACCKVHGVRELWSADRDFSRFSGVTIRNPLIGRLRA